jgi:hypothetical protein
MIKFNLEEYNKDGEKYINSLIDTLCKKLWKELETEKFSENTTEEIKIMKTLWTHGYSKGAETATQILMSLYESLKQSK